MVHAFEMAVGVNLILQGLGCTCLFVFVFPFSLQLLGLSNIISIYILITCGLVLLYGAQQQQVAAVCCSRHLKPRSLPFLLLGKHVLITGGSKGIGLSLAIESVKRKAAIVSLIARDLSGLAHAQNACIEVANKLQTNVIIQTISADLSDSHAAINCLDVAKALKGSIALSVAASAAREEKRETGSPIDVFLSNAAFVDPRPLNCLSVKSISACTDVNLKTPILQVAHVLPSMRERGFGVVCFSNSLATFVPIYGLAAYSATKAALKTFAEAINQEVTGSGVLVSNAFLPSVDTPGFEQERRVRHRLTDLLESTTKVRKPDEVAKRLIDSLEAGQRVITFDFEGWMLARLNAGFSRAESLTSLLFEFFFSGLFRAGALALFVHFSRIITKERLGRKLKSKMS